MSTKFVCRPWYIFLPSYWLPSGAWNVRHRPGMASTASGPQLLQPRMQQQPPAVGLTMDADVAQEEARVST